VRKRERVKWTGTLTQGSRKNVPLLPLASFESLVCCMYTCIQSVLCRIIIYYLEFTLCFYMFMSLLDVGELLCQNG